MSGGRRRAVIIEAARAFLGDRMVELEPLGIRPGREVYRCRSSEAVVVAKWYPDARRARVAATAHSLLGGTHRSVRCPRLLHLDEGRCTLIQEHLDGLPVFSALAGDPGPLVRRAGHAVADLHSLDVRLPACLSRTASLDGAKAAVAEMDGQWRQQGEAAVQAAEQLLARSEPGRPVPSHGDFGWAQLLELGGPLGVVDLDHAAMAEAALDLGNLVAQLLRRDVEAGGLVGELLDAYARQRGPVAVSDVYAYALVVVVRKLRWVNATRRREVFAAAAALLDLVQG